MALDCYPVFVPPRLGGVGRVGARAVHTPATHAHHGVGAGHVHVHHVSAVRPAAHLPQFGPPVPVPAVHCVRVPGGALPAGPGLGAPKAAAAAPKLLGLPATWGAFAGVRGALLAGGLAAAAGGAALGGAAYGGAFGGGGYAAPSAVASTAAGPRVLEETGAFGTMLSGGSIAGVQGTNVADVGTAPGGAAGTIPALALMTGSGFGGGAASGTGAAGGPAGGSAGAGDVGPGGAGAGGSVPQAPAAEEVGPGAGGSVAVPEPGTLAVLGIAVLMALGLRRRDVAAAG